MRFLVLAFAGYGLAWWGSTLLAGGPNNTGGWPLMYALFKLGSGPPTMPVKAGSQESSPESASTPFQAAATTTVNPPVGFTNQP